MLLNNVFSILQLQQENLSEMAEVMTWLNNGLAVLIVIAIGFAIWRSSSVLFHHVIVPMKDAGLSHLNNVHDYMKSTTKALDHTADALQSISTEVREIRLDIDNIKDDIETKLKKEHHA